MRLPVARTTITAWVFAITAQLNPARENAAPSATAPLQNPTGQFNVRTYGALASGGDDTSAIQAAIDACKAAGGGIVQFPPGNFRINAGLKIDTATNITLAGSGRNATSLIIGRDDVSPITFTGVCSRCGIRDMWIGSFVARKTGVGIDITGTPSVHSDTFDISNVLIQNVPTPFAAQYADIVSVTSCRIIQTISGATVGAAFVLQNCIEWRVTNLWVSAIKGTLSSDAVVIDHDCDTIVLSGASVGHAKGAGFSLRKTSGSTGPRLIRLTNCYSESNNGPGFAIYDGRDVRLIGCESAVNGGPGYEIAGGDSVSISDSVAMQNKQHGLLVRRGQGVILSGNTCANNSQAENGAYDGIHIANGVQDVRCTNNRSGDFMFRSENHQRYGLAIGAEGTNAIVATGNILTGNKSGGLGNFSKGTNNVILLNVP